MTITINGTTGIAGVDGSAATPAVQGADTNTGMFFPAADTIAFANGGAEAMRIDSGGDVGIGTTTPAEPLSVVGQVSVSGASGGFLLRSRNTNASSSQWYSPTVGSTRLYDTTNAVDRLSVDASGNFSFNSGYGSAAVAYGCRAWVNFDGTGTVAIRASGNVTSITDNGTGDYTINLTTAMPDLNYAVAANCGITSAVGYRIVAAPFTAAYTTSAYRIGTANTSPTAADVTFISVAFFR